MQNKKYKITVSNLDAELELHDELNSLNSENEAINFPDSVYTNLPEFLKKSSQLFENPNERDAFLISALGVISGCLPNIQGCYNNFMVHPNIYVFVLAKAAAGKSAIRWSRKIASEIHRKIVENSNKLQERYESEFKIFQKSESISEEPKKPKFKTFFIPANISHAGFIELFENNEGNGILHETEADTLSSTLAKDWGSFSHTIRGSYQHEPVTQYRKTNNSKITQLENPKLSIVLSGTPEQVVRLIPNAEDGLFSRFCYYYFPYTIEWENVFDNSKNHSQFFNNQSVILSEFYDKLLKIPNHISFEFTISQQESFNKHFEALQIELALFIHIDLVPTVRRLGLICFRIAMILSCLRLIKFEELPTKIICLDEDFNNAMSISSTLSEHAISIFSRLSKDIDKAQIDEKKKTRAKTEASILELASLNMSYSQIAIHVFNDASKKSRVQYYLEKNAKSVQK